MSSMSSILGSSSTTNTSIARTALYRAPPQRREVKRDEVRDRIVHAAVDLMCWLDESGSVGEAIAQFEELVADRTRLFGADHPDTPTTRGMLGLRA